MSHITVLAGGRGAAKLVVGLVEVVPEEDVHVIVNVASDHQTWGLRVCPDIDTILYALAGELDAQRGWGRTHQSFNCQDTIRKLGMRSRTEIGDRDLATHVLRSHLLNQGVSLVEATRTLADRFGIGAVILPASNDPVRTLIQDSGGTCPLEEFQSRSTSFDSVVGVQYDGADVARAAEEALDSIRSASRVVIAPADPVLDIGPMLAIPGIREALAHTEAGVVAVSPIIGSQPVSGKAGRLMEVTGSNAVSARAVAERYSEFLDHIVIHTTDVADLEPLREVGVGVWVENILINNPDESSRLARRLTNEARTFARKKAGARR